jgi:hypothetical protein
LAATMIRRRRRALVLDSLPPLELVDEIPELAEGRWPTWRQDVRFFLGCYAAGLAFFLIMLS